MENSEQPWGIFFPAEDLWRFPSKQKGWISLEKLLGFRWIRRRISDLSPADFRLRREVFLFVMSDTRIPLVNFTLGNCVPFFLLVIFHWGPFVGSIGSWFGKSAIGVAPVKSSIFIGADGYHRKPSISGWWLGCHQFYFPINIGFRLSSPLTKSYFSGRGGPGPPTRFTFAKGKSLTSAMGPMGHEAGHKLCYPLVNNHGILWWFNSDLKGFNGLASGKRLQFANLKMGYFVDLPIKKSWWFSMVMLC